MAKAPSVTKILEKMADEFLACRDLGHIWDHHTAKRLQGGGYERSLICKRCTRTKTQLLNRRGDVVSDSKGNWWPEGYLMPAGTGRLTGSDRGKLRVEAMERTLVSPRHLKAV